MKTMEARTKAVRTINLVVAAAVMAALCTPAVAQVSYTPVPTVVQLPPGATYPQVVSSQPQNGSINANAGNQQIIINFDQAMNVTTFYWQYPTTSDFPQITQQPYWTNGNKTFVIPATLQRNTTYRIPLNVYDQAFKSAVGVPLTAGYITFTTSGSGSSSFRTGSSGIGTTVVGPGPTTNGGVTGTPFSTNGSFPAQKLQGTGAGTAGAISGGFSNGSGGFSNGGAGAAKVQLGQQQKVSTPVPGSSTMGAVGAAGVGAQGSALNKNAGGRRTKTPQATPTPSAQ
jgi:hypothetical protein